MGLGTGVVTLVRGDPAASFVGDIVRVGLSRFREMTLVALPLERRRPSNSASR